MNLKIPSIGEYALSAYRDLIEKEKELIKLKNGPYHELNSYIISSKEEEIKYLKKKLSKYKSSIRDEKLKELGI